MDIRDMNQAQRKERLNQIFDSGFYRQEIFELLLNCPILTENELNIELNNNPAYYPKYLSDKNLTMMDIYRKIIKDLDDFETSGWLMGSTQRQIYSHLNLLIKNEKNLNK